MFRRIGMPCYRPFVVQVVVVVLLCVLLLVRLFVCASSHIRFWKVVVSSSWDSLVCVVFSVFDDVA